ncbi:Kelch repeat-containing protein 3 [Thecaphora frezii]
MAKKKAGAGKAAAKAAKKEKAEKLANKKATKQAKKENALLGGSGAAAKGGSANTKKKGVKNDLDDEEDLDLLLARYREKWEAEHAVNEEKIGGPPSRRANATLTPCPLGNDLYLFGGEYFDGERVAFYQDMYRFIPERNEWRSYSSQNQPGPRSAHQVAATPSQGGMLWLFGGEFSGARQNAFHHYRDLWAFSIESKAWERIDTKVRPSARSGHRMTFWKHYLVLFGGFIDTGVKTQYLNDLWVFDTQNTFKWTEIKQNDLRRPTPRSGFSFLACPDGIVLHGGYCKKYVKGQRTQGVALEDTWFLKMDEDLKNLDWVKRRKVGYVPSARSGCTMALWQTKSMGVLFGGVTDTEADEESMESTFHKDLFGYQLPGTGRWISLNLKRPKKMGGGNRRKKQKQQQQQQEREQRQREAEEEAQRRREEDDDDYSHDEDDDKDDEDDEDDEGRSRPSKNGAGDKPAEDGPTKEAASPTPSASASALGTAAAAAPAPAAEMDDDPDDPEKTRPLERYNTMLAVQRNILYLYGGIYESGNREYTLDDFYTLDLAKLEKFNCLKECPIDALEWNESEDEDDSDDDEDDEDDDESDSGSSSGEEGDEIPEGYEFGEYDEEDEEAKRAKMSQAEKDELRAKAKAFLGVAQDSQRSEVEQISTPSPGENLRAFYERTKSHWANVAFTESEGKLRGKETRKAGFALAEQKYSEYKPILEEVRGRALSLSSPNLSRFSPRAIHLASSMLRCNAQPTSPLSPSLPLFLLFRPLCSWSWDMDCLCGGVCCVDRRWIDRTHPSRSRAGRGGKERQQVRRYRRGRRRCRLEEPTVKPALQPILASFPLKSSFLAHFSFYTTAIDCIIPIPLLPTPPHTVQTSPSIERAERQLKFQ